MNRALVLSGGGARGAFQVGMLRELVINQRLDFQIIRGVSVGSLNAAFLAQAPTEANSQAELAKKVGALQDLWESEITGNHSIYADRAGFAGLILGADSLYSLKPLRSLVKDNLSFDAIKSSGRDFAVGTVSLVSGRYEEWRADDDAFFERFIASSSIPVVFPYVDIPDMDDVLVDGGVRNITPLTSAFRATPPPDEIYVLLASRVIREDGSLPKSAAEIYYYKQWDDNFLGTKVNGLHVLRRTLDLLTDEIYLDDIRGALDWNEVAGAVSEVETAQSGAGNIPDELTRAVKQLATSLENLKKRHVPIFVLAPQQWFDEDEE